ncbi:hypothetical protein NQ318_019724 [Aromia moschata]|uniref:Methuselah N-terminal domain-containing protein n=1 Tax=Aromia moschata TaxID=1265417 RepID=A0AAV8Z498_9CUCU|nr:hypothetical protein NQ318_019724 [Aromia moschata]
MLYYLFLSTLTDGASMVTSTTELAKCCDFGSAFFTSNGSHFCNKTDSTREMLKTNLVFNKTRGECVEILNSRLYLFEVKDSVPFARDDITYVLVPKCCPKNFSYVPSLHSCVEDNKNDLFNTNDVSVGLPSCKITYDYELALEDEFVVYKNYIHLPGFGEEIPRGEYCVDRTTRNTFVVKACKSYDVCTKVQCIHKCCSDGKSFVNGSHCIDTYIYGINLDYLAQLVGNYSDDIALVHGYETGVYIPTKFNFYLDERGNFYSYEEKIGNKMYPADEETYCIEHATKNGIIYGYTLFRIIPKTESFIEKKFLFNRWAMVVSCVFLILTIMYYVISGERNKVFGKILISFCTSLLVLFVLLIYSAFKSDLKLLGAKTLCKATVL